MFRLEWSGLPLLRARSRSHLAARRGDSRHEVETWARTIAVEPLGRISAFCVICGRFRMTRATSEKCAVTFLTAARPRVAVCCRRRRSGSSDSRVASVAPVTDGSALSYMHPSLCTEKTKEEK